MRSLSPSTTRTDTFTVSPARKDGRSGRSWLLANARMTCSIIFVRFFFERRENADSGEEVHFYRSGLKFHLSGSIAPYLFLYGNPRRKDLPIHLKFTNVGSVCCSAGFPIKIP